MSGKPQLESCSFQRIIDCSAGGNRQAAAAVAAIWGLRRSNRSPGGGQNEPANEPPLRTRLARANKPD